jgi:transcriptional antiterminator Rof (Rho-off)
MFGQHPTELAVSSSGVRNVSSGRGFILILGSSFCRLHLPMKMELIEGSKMSAYTNQTPGNYPKENLIYSEHGESLKSRIHSQRLSTHLSTKNIVHFASNLHI